MAIEQINQSQTLTNNEGQLPNANSQNNTAVVDSVSLLSTNESDNLRPSEIVDPQVESRTADIERDLDANVSKPAAPVFERLQKAIDIANDFASVNQRRLEFSLSGEPARPVVRVLNREDNELIRQIPSEEFVRISQRIQSLNEEFENVRGLLFDTLV